MILDSNIIESLIQLVQSIALVTISEYLVPVLSKKVRINSHGRPPSNNLMKLDCQ